MQAPAQIAQIWSQFNGIPMETLTKAWWHGRCNGAPRQRTPQEMAAHRAAYGTGGNCFDLAVWFLDACAQAGVTAYPVGHDLETPDAHVAAVAISDSGAEYLCDLGDQWLRPIRITDPEPGWHSGFFPAAEVSVERHGAHVTVLYRYSNGKGSRQSYDLTPIGPDALVRACHHSQNLLRMTLCEHMAVHPETGLREKWEYESGRSFWSLGTGLVVEEPCPTPEAWADRIWERTGISHEVILTAFAVYGGL